MIKLLFWTLFLVKAHADSLMGGWNPIYCCYPPPEECCPTPTMTPFTTTATTATTSAPCPPCLDVAFVIDISSSIGNVTLHNVINPFLKMFAESDDWVIGTGDGEVQASATTFANDAEIEWNWMSPETADKDALSEAFGKLQTTQFQGLTNTPAALNLTRIEVLGGPGNRPDCPDVCLLLTDGHVTVDAPLFPAAAEAFREACDLSVVVGITTGVNPDELEQIASSFDEIIMVDEFDQLAGFFSTIMDKIRCPNGGGGGATTTPSATTTMPTMPPPTTKMPGKKHDCCPYDYPYYFELMKKW